MITGNTSKASPLLLVVGVFIAVTLTAIKLTTLPPNLKDRVENEGFTIGDEHRSKKSTNSFFSSIDQDRDGTLTRPELSSFLYEKVGGVNFDEKEEVDRGIDIIIKNLDQNKDDGLDVGDVTSYLKSLDRVLGVKEVADWIEHAVQLPHEVAL